MNSKPSNLTEPPADRRPQAQSPIEATPTHIGEAEHTAAGLPSIYQTTRISLEEMGINRTLRTLLALTKKDGFDCQSCAWPSPDEHRKVAEFCENGAKAVASEATTRRVTTEFFTQWSVTALSEQSDYWLDQQGRLTQPMFLRAGGTHYEPIAWQDAFALLAQELTALDSPNEATFYTSGRTSNEAAFLFQLFARQFGTNNLPDCSNMCHESSTIALTENLGLGKSTVRLDDFEKTDLILIIGQNPGTNHPRMLSSLERARKNGAKIIGINPLFETGLLRVANPNPQEYDNLLAFPAGVLGKGTELASDFLQLRINSDIAVLKGLMKTLLDEEAKVGGVIDHGFIDEHTVGFQALLDDLKATAWADIVECCGIPEADIRRVGLAIAYSKRMIVCWAMGLTQHKNAVATIQTLVNLMLLGGHIGREGAGICCVRGHSNVQGDRTMGIWEKMPDTFLDALKKEFDFEPPREHGFDTVNSIKAMHDGTVKVFFGLGGNFLSATPDTEYTAQAMRRCRLTAHVSTKLNRSHLVTGTQALILPCLGRTEKDIRTGQEQFITIEDTMMVVNPSKGVLSPGSPYLLSEPAIIAGLARATLGERSKIQWEALSNNYDLIREHISHVVPGFENFNVRIQKDIFYLPNPIRSRVFTTNTGQANFYVHPLPEHVLQPGQLMLMTIRSHDQFNTTIYGLDDRYRGVYGGRRVIFLNRADMAELEILPHTQVDITSHFEGEQRTAKAFQVVPYDIPRRCAAAYFPETNVLVAIGSRADKSNSPASKSIVISLNKSTELTDSTQ